MLKTLLLAFPVFVTFFWSITLQLGQQQRSPQAFLGKFMAFAFIVYASHFIFFASFPSFYLYIDPLYQYASLMVYPMFHIYIRLLTIDRKFSFRKHSIYLAAPTILGLLYLIGAGSIDKDSYHQLLFGDGQPVSFSGLYQRIMMLLIKIVFLIQVVFTVWKNYWLLKTYGNKAGQYYSDIEKSNINKATLLNITMLIVACASLILRCLGRHYFTDELTGITIASITFSSTLFVIGLLGYQQELINPMFETAETPTINKTSETKTKVLEQQLSKALENKIYLNPSLTIRDLASAIGSNRTYLSNYINSEHKTSFCAYVNKYRVKELQSILKENPQQSLEILADLAGFGCIDSLKRAVKNETGITFNDWKKQIQSTHK